MPTTESYRQFCRNRRVYLKDRLAHPGIASAWTECLAVEGFSHDELREKQAARLRRLVDHAVKYVPFYQQWSQDTGYRLGDVPRLTDLPVVTKENYRQSLDAFQSSTHPLGKMKLAKTSGSSGEPFRFRMYMPDFTYAYCCFWRALRRHGLRSGDRRVYVWGRSYTFGTRRWGVAQTRVKHFLRDWFNSTLSINAYDLAQTNVAQAVQRIERFRPAYALGYTSALYAIARHMRDQGKAFGFQLKAAICESEKLYDFQRDTIAEAFKCPVVEHYGSVELGPIAEQDPQGNLRINEDLVLVERGTAGEAIVTNLHAYGFPFIRYKLGDLIEIDSAVPSPLPYSVLRKVVGRTVDLIPIAAGGYVHGVSLAHVIDPHLDVVSKYQVHQRAIDEFIVRLVVRRPLEQESQRRIVNDMRRLVGEHARIDLDFVDDIPPAKSGKFRWVTSEISDVARQTLGGS